MFFQIWNVVLLLINIRRDQMDNKEWVKQFEEQNGRKPTPEEFVKFLSENKMGEKRKKWGRVIIATLVLATVIVSFFAYQSYIKWTKSDSYFYKYSQVATLDKNQEEEINKFVLEYLKSLDESVNSKSNVVSSYFDSHDNDSYKKVVQEVSGFNAQSIETKQEQTKDYKILNDKIGFTTQSIQKIKKNDGKPEIVFYTTHWILIKKDTEYKISSIETKINENIKGTMKDYQVVIDEYKKAIDNDRVSNNPGYINAEPFYKYGNNKSKPVLSYALYDFDHNGVNELVIANGGEKIDKKTDEKSESNSDTKLKWGREIYNIITLDGSRIVDNFPQVGYRMHVYPMTDGSFWFYGSGSAFLHNVEHYKFTNDGTKITKVLSVKFDSEDKVTHKVRKIPTIEDQTGKTYTQESFQNLLNQYTVLNEDKLLWTEIK